MALNAYVTHHMVPYFCLLHSNVTPRKTPIKLSDTLLQNMQLGLKKIRFQLASNTYFVCKPSAQPEIAECTTSGIATFRRFVCLFFWQSLWFILYHVNQIIDLIDDEISSSDFSLVPAGSLKKTKQKVKCSTMWNN